MIYKVQTTHSLEDIKQTLEEKAKDVGFSVLTSYAFKEILESKGFPIEKDITVFELCTPKAAQQLLTQIPEISVYLPCRISVYEENGTSTLATIGFEDILNAVEVDDYFKSSMTAVFENLKILMHRWDN
jgi:uncharacterized protein (DUF302 family)